MQSGEGAPGGAAGSGALPAGPLAAPIRERINFVPHPLTITAAGDYEYFAAQGRHPFVYALAEFLDNSLRATRSNAPRPRAITVSLVVSGSNPATARGLVSVHDNGCGMNKQELNAWAVMNYSMEERGKAPQEPEAAGRGAAGTTGAGRFLSGDISFFGVGSKNAAFFMGGSVKVTTKRAEEAHVHELCLRAQELEQRYRDQEEVYVEDMVHRNPGDASTLAAMEQPFAMAHEWVAQEEEQQADGGGCSSSFTRVVVGDLKQEVLSQVLDDEEGAVICQELAHLYHYYLHGEQGNRAGSSAAAAAAREGRLPNGEPFPDITLELRHDRSLVWRRRLAEVDDDMETKLLRTQKAELPFTLHVPDKGQVCGVLYYFPYENDHETVPMEPNAFFRGQREDSPIGAGRLGAGLTQRGPTQMPRGTQAGPRATQAPRPTQHPGGGAHGEARDDDEDEDGLLGWQSHPIFEAFWQGRLIPGARIDSLPFIESVRQKRTAQAKDVIPDEAFRRLRGALFFGPAFKVTRNKLLFRDDLAKLLATAVPAERQMEAKFKQWLQRCHTTLDKSVRFEALADSRMQAAVRAKLGEATTAFERISDGARTVSKGDVVRINAKPVVVGRVLYITVPQVAKEEGCYANGRLHVELLPSELHGLACEKAYSLRRLEAVLSETELQEHVNTQLKRVATSLRLEPMRLATGQALEVVAGDSLPETTVAVLNGAQQKMTRSAHCSERIAVTQRLWYLGQQQQKPETGTDPTARPAKRQRRRKGRGRQDENAAPEAEEGESKASAIEAVALSAEGELVAEFENKTPIDDAFSFKRLKGFERAGRYAVEYIVSPAAPGQEPLRQLLEICVLAAAPTALKLSGEGKVASALRPFALGEALPSFNVVLSDSFGNPVLLQPTLTPPSVSVCAAVPAADGSLQPCPELAVSLQQQPGLDGLVLSQLQVLGIEEAAEAAAGLQLFKAGEGPTHPTARQAQQRPSQAALPLAEVHVCISLQQSSELEPESFPLQLRPGAPQVVRLLPGHPWQEADMDSSSSVVSLQHSEALPDFSVQAFDAWGCATGPSEHLPFKLLVECPALSPSRQEFEFSPVGVASVTGLVATAATQDGAPAELTLSLLPAPNTPGADTAFAAAGALQSLTCRVAVAPSAEAASLMILKDGMPLERRRERTGEGVQVVELPGQQAGEQITGLTLKLINSGGGDAQPTKGRVTVSWRSGNPRRDWDGQALKLPNKLAAPELVSDSREEWVRFVPDEGPSLEACLAITSRPGEPAGWGASLVEQATSQSPDELGAVQCGQPFALEVEVLDRYGNRCGRNAEGLMPQPQLSVTAEDDTPLQYCEQDWEQGWVSQGGEDVYAIKMVLSGHPGRVKVTVASAEADALQLRPDSLTLDLRAGAPAALCIDGLASLDCGTRAVIPQLRVRVCDAAGNPTTCDDTFDLSINNSALSSDGSGRSASVSVNGGNKTKMKKGTATFKDVRVTAEEAGSYALRVQSASRKVALQDAVVHLVMAPQNTVTDLRVVMPEGLADSLHAGSSAELHVALGTENGVPLPAEVAASSLVLRVTPPGGSKSDAIVCSLAQGEGAGEQTEGGMYAFQLEELSVSGTYNAVAEYTESRPELLAGMSKKDAVLRSSTLQFTVLPGEPVTVALQSTSGPLPEQVTATNGPNLRQRCLLRAVAVQLQDAHGNAAETAGVQLRFSIRAADPATEVPVLQMVEGLSSWETDVHGRAFVGDLLVQEGSGSAPAGALECELVCQALGLYPSSAFAHETDEEGWAACWHVPVLFSDDAARFAALQQLNQQREELVARRHVLSERLSAAQHALAEASSEQQRVVQAMQERQRSAPGPLPDTVKAAQRQLAKLQKQREALADADAAPPAVRAKYGRARQAMTNALDKALQSGDAGVVGVVAQLATIEDDMLSRVASAQYRGLLGVLVVRDADARQRLLALLQEQRYPVPDMMAVTMCLPFRSSKQAEVPGFQGAGQRAQQLLRAACSSSDHPLPLQLTHMQVMGRMKEADLAGLAGQGPGAQEWPQGCCGYMVNLVRPVRRGHRAALLFSLLGQTLVFETLADASTYREFVVQKLRASLPDVVTLDGQKLSSKGIISGSASFQLPANLEQADYCFGSCGAGGADDPAAADTTAQLAAMEEWLGLLRERATVDVAATEAQAAADDAKAEFSGELEQVDSALADLEAQLALGEMANSKAAAPSSRKKRGRRQQQSSESPLAEEQQQGGGGKRRRRDR